MKKAGWIATIAAGVVLVGGGAWGATTLATRPTTSAGGVSDTAAPVAPEPSATPEVTPTPSVEPTPEATHSEEEQVFLDWARPLLAGYGAQMSDDDMLGYLRAACQIESGEAPDVPLVPGTVEPEYGGGWPDDATAENFAANNIDDLFRGAAQNGYSTNGTTLDESYCD